jgi:hypothetical protein
VEAEHEGRSGAGPKIEDERSASSATAFIIYKNTEFMQIHISTDSGKNIKERCVMPYLNTVLGHKWHPPMGSMTFQRAQKSLDFQGPTPSNMPL